MVVFLRSKDANVKRLEYIGKVRREIKQLNIVLSYLRLEFKRTIRFMTVK